MKFNTLSSLVCLSSSAWLAHAAPVADAQAQTVTVVPIPATAGASPYPTPTTNEILYLNYDEKSSEDKGDRFIVHSAFVPFAQIMQAGISAVADTKDDTYDRWFPANVKQGSGKPSVDGRGYVSNVYRQLLAPGTNPSPQPRVKTLVHDHNDFGKTCKPDTNAYMVGRIGQFHVCKPKGLLNQPMIAAPANCSSFGTQVSSAMHSLSATLIHEFMHWNQVGELVPNSVGHITDVLYGPSSCMRLARGADKQKTFINADSYTWMALNAYYNSVCNKKFGDPLITQQDFDDGMAQLLDSPEYNEAMSEGVLAGV